VAGLAAAWRLAEAGRRVVLYEAAPSAGGMLASVTRAGVTADTAVQLLSSTYERTLQLAASAGAQDLLVPVAGQDAVWRRGAAHPIRYGAVSSMLASRALPTMLKLRLGAKYVPFLGTRAGGLDANDLARTALGHDDETIAAWGSREMGDDFVEYLVYPLLAAYYGTLPEQASAGLYHALARVGMDVQLRAIRGGAARFAEALVNALERAGVEIRTTARVRALEFANGLVGVRTDAGEDALAGVVIAAPPQNARLLLPAVSPAHGWLERVRTAPAVTLTLWLRERIAEDWFGVSFPRAERPGDVLVAACVQSRKPGLVAGAGDAIVLYPAPGWLATRAQDDDDALQRPLLASLEQAMPGVGRRIEAVTVHRHEGGYRVFEVGHLRRIAEFERGWLPAKCALAGDYLVAPTVEGAVRSGLQAAGALLA
jgi:oxygen-dependent protoporphyrinogen oxidase